MKRILLLIWLVSSSISISYGQFTYTNISYAKITPSSDNSADFQALIDANSNKKIIIGAGTYIIGTTLNFNNPITFEGVDNALVIFQLKAGASTAVFKVQSSNVSIKNISIDGNAANAGTNSTGITTASGTARSGLEINKVKCYNTKGTGYGFNIVDYSNVKIINCEITQGSIAAYIPIFIVTTAVNISDIEITGNLVDRTSQGLSLTQGCIQVHGVAGSFTISDVRISQNRVFAPVGTIVNSGGGICIETYGNVYNAMISSNYCYGGDMGISMDRTFYGNCINNCVESSYTYGIEKAGSSGINIVGNTISGNGILKEGISINALTGASSQITATNNVIKNTLNRGISVNNTLYTVLTSNIIDITNAGSYGINILNSANDCVVTGNILNGNGSANTAILIDKCSGVTMSGNRINNWLTNSGVLLYSDAAVTIDNITFTGNYCNGTNRGVQTQLSNGGAIGANIKVLGNPNVVDYLDFKNQVMLRTTTATPEGAITASPGAVYLQTNGGPTKILWAKETGTNTNTGWVNYGLKVSTTSMTFNGSTTAFTIAHGMSVAPTWFTMDPTNAAGATVNAGVWWWSADATNVTVTFTTAPAAGTANFTWSAKL